MLTIGQTYVKIYTSKANTTKNKEDNNMKNIYKLMVMTSDGMIDTYEIENSSFYEVTLNCKFYGEQILAASTWDGVEWLKLR